MATAVLSGFFSLNGYALRGASRRGLERAFQGRARDLLAAVFKHLRELAMLCSLLRSLCNLALLVMVLYLFERSAEDSIWSIVSAIAVTGTVIALFSVAVPHAWAHYSGPAVLARTARILLAVRIALWPILFVMRAVDLPVRRLSGAPDPSDRRANGEAGNDSAREDAVKAEILQVATEGQAEGAVNEGEVDMIESVIEFGDRQAGEIMTPRTDIVALPLYADDETVYRTIVEAGHTRLPIYDGDIDNIVGILHAKDLLAIPRGQRLELRRIMRKPFFIPETKPLDDLLTEFKARKSHQAIVLDEYGGTAGLITVEDLIEEIVGDIADEYDQPESALLKRIDARTVEVDGRMHIDELNDALGLALPEEEDFDTVAGLVFSELGQIPAVGASLAVRGATFTVLAADERKITRLKIELPALTKRTT